MLVARCFSCWLQWPRELAGFAPFICWLLQGAAAACWVPSSCCFLLLLLHGSYLGESFLISKRTHSQSSTPPKIGTHSYIFSPAKIIKLWEKNIYIFGCIWNTQCIRWVGKLDNRLSHSRATGYHLRLAVQVIVQVLIEPWRRRLVFCSFSLKSQFCSSHYLQNL